MGRSPCCEKAHTNKGAWTREEDERLVGHIRAQGEGCWRSLPRAAGLQRCGKSCRLRWINYLRPDLKRGNFTQQEDHLIIDLHSLLGNKWSVIAGRLPGRTDNEIKNYWNTHIRRKLLARGIDPATHRPISFDPPNKTTDVVVVVAKHQDKSSTTSSSCSDDSQSSSPPPPPWKKQQQQLPQQLFRVPDLNLELRISPPEPVADDGQMEGLLCFRCSLGSSSKGCKCNISKDGFLQEALDYTSV